MFNGRKLKKLRKKYNLTQSSLAQLVNLNKTSISYFERNMRTPSIETLIDLSKVLNTTPHYLLDIEEIITISDNIKEYKIFLSKKDIDIINEIKNHNEFYNKLCENPKEFINKIIKLLY